MNLDPRFNPVAIVTALVTLIGLGGAFMMGQAAAQGNFRFIGLVFGGGAGMLVVFAFRQYIWLLVPITWELSGRLGGLPLPFSIREICVMMAFGGLCAQVAMKQSRVVAPKVNASDVLLWVNIAVVAVMYLRNPVGVSALGGDTVGGRPYFGVIIGVLAYLVLSRQSLTPEMGYRFPIFIVGANLCLGLLNTLTYIFPPLVPIIHPIYSGVDISSYMSEEFEGQKATTSLSEGRFTGMGLAGIAILLLLISYYSPLRLISPMSPALFAGLGLCGIFIAFAGFRSRLALAAMFVFTATYFWARGNGVVRLLVLTITGVGLLLVAQNVVDLPRSIQRSLSFLPGNWNENVKRGAQESTDWRWEMWKIALTTDRYIQDKLLGDGFGFTRKELEIMFSASIGQGAGFLGEDNTKEAFMIQGSFHSGPVSAIRFAGYLGLALFLWLMIVNAQLAVRLLRQAWGTPFQPLAIFMATTAAIAPVFFVLIFGEYRSDLPNVFFGVGLLKLLQNSLAELPASATRTGGSPRPIERVASGLKPVLTNAHLS
jgi:hypothetical protein